MKNSISLNEIKNDLEYLNDYWTVVYGSYITEKFMPNRSDIDIAVITREKEELTNKNIWIKLLEHSKIVYDIKIFELLPLYIKMNIINDYTVLFGDPLEISEYFYFYRKIWKDMEPRIQANKFKNIKEKIILTGNRQKFLQKL